MTAPLYGCIEAGGTNLVLGVARDHHGFLETGRIATASLGETLATAVDFFRQVNARHGRITAFGIASFGQLDVDVRGENSGMRALALP